MKEVNGKGRPARPAEDSQTTQGARDFHRGPGAHISANATLVKSFQVIISLVEVPWPTCLIPAGYWESSHTSIPRPSCPDEWSLVETQNFRNSNHLPAKDNYFTMCFVESTFGLSTIYFSYFFFSSLLDSRSIKSENHKKHHLGRQKKQTDLTTEQGSWPWPAQEHLRLQRATCCPWC